MSSQSPFPLVKRTSYGWLKTGCLSVNITLPSRRSGYAYNYYVMFYHYFLVIVVSLICPFTGNYCHSKHGLPASRVPVPARGCREATTLRPVGHFRLEGPERFLDGGGGEFTTLGVKGQGSH